MLPVKRRSLASESLDNNKSVCDLPGVGAILGARLKEAGYEKAIQVRTKLIELGNNKENFQSWMKTVCNASSLQSSECFEGLNDSCENFMRQ